MVRGNPAALALGPGYLYIGSLGRAEPTDLTTPWATVDPLWIFLGYCVDEETEILTRRGWLRHDQVTSADECLGISRDDGLARWQPITAMHRFPAMRREMIAMRGAGHDSLSTPNHRWLVDRRPGDAPELVTGAKGGRAGRLFTTTDSFHWADRVPCAAPVVNLPGEAKYTDALVELVAWWMTEGSLAGTSMTIYQSERVNPQHCASIRAALTVLFGPAVPSMFSADVSPSRPDRAARGRITEPAWREATHKSCVTFHLNKAATAAITEHAPDKVIRPEFVCSLTGAQLLLLLDTAIAGDGWHGSFISQRDRERLEPLQMAASLAGLRTHLYPGNGGWVLSILQSAEFHPRRRMTRITVVHDGPVWCPSTPAQTWLARRNGTVYFTGNTSTGSEFNYQLSTSPVDVAEELDALSNAPTGRQSSVIFALAQMTATNLSYALNGGVVTTGTGVVTVEPPDLGSEVRMMLGFEAEDHTERWVWRQGINTGQLKIQRQKGANPALLDQEFMLEKPATGAKLFKAVFASPARA